MDIGKKPSLVLYLERSRFDLYSENQNRVYNFDLSPFVANLEVKNREALHAQISNFITTYSIPTGNIVIVLAESVLFIKAIPPVNNVEQEDEEIQNFSDSVPFEHVELKSYPIESGKLLVAANKDYYNSIKNSFEKVGFLTSIVAPIYSTGVSVDPVSGLNVENGRSILKSIDNLRVSSFEVMESAQKSPTPQEAPKPNRSRIYILSGVFGFLILILLVVIFTSSSQTPPPTPKVNTAVTPAVNTVSAPAASISASFDPASVRINLGGATGTTSQQQQITQALKSGGFGTVIPSLEQRETTVPLLIFSPDVPGELRTQIAEVVSQYANNFTVEEEEDPDFDVLIYLR